MWGGGAPPSWSFYFLFLLLSESTFPLLVCVSVCVFSVSSHAACGHLSSRSEQVHLRTSSTSFSCCCSFPSCCSSSFSFLSSSCCFSPPPAAVAPPSSSPPHPLPAPISLPPSPPPAPHLPPPVFSLMAKKLEERSCISAFTRVFLRKYLYFDLQVESVSVFAASGKTARCSDGCCQWCCCHKLTEKLTHKLTHVRANAATRKHSYEPT